MYTSQSASGLLFACTDPRSGCPLPVRNEDQAMTASISFHPGMLVLERYARRLESYRTDMHGDKWQPPLRLVKDAKTGRTQAIF